MKIGTMLLIIVAIDAFLFMAQLGIDNVKTEIGGTGIINYDYQGSILQTVDSGNYTLNSDISGNIPSGQPQIDASGTSVFTDLWNTFKSWILSIPGVSYLYKMVTAMGNFLQLFGFPQEIAYALGAMWHIMSFVLLVVFIRGGTEI